MVTARLSAVDHSDSALFQDQLVLVLCPCVSKIMYHNVM